MATRLDVRDKSSSPDGEVSQPILHIIIPFSKIKFWASGFQLSELGVVVPSFEEEGHANVIIGAIFKIFIQFSDLSIFYCILEFLGFIGSNTVESFFYFGISDL